MLANVRKSGDQSGRRSSPDTLVGLGLPGSASAINNPCVPGVARLFKQRLPGVSVKILSF